MILPIYLYGSEKLRNENAEADIQDKEGLTKLISDMWETLKAADGCGLAAPQVGVLRRVSVAFGGIAIFLLALLIVFRVNGTPKINGTYVLTGNGGPHVYHDNDWSLAVVRSYFPSGAHFFIKSGVPSSAEDSGEVWLFGDVAESSHRFPCSNVTVVDPPEFYVPEKNVTWCCWRGTCLTVIPAGIRWSW